MYIALLLSLLGATPPTTTAPVPTSPAAVERIYLAPLRAGEGVDDNTRRLIEDAVLVAARQRDPRVIGSGDLEALLDVDAAAQAMGCSSTGCDAELADALGAPELLTGQVSRLGDSWVLTMSRLAREELTVLARHQVTRQGAAGDVLLAAVPELLDALFGAAPGPSPVVVGGGIGAGLGVATAGIGGVLYFISRRAYDDGLAALPDNPQKAFEARRDYEPMHNVGVAMAAAGAGIAVIGGIVFVVGLASEQP